MRLRPGIHGVHPLLPRAKNLQIYLDASRGEGVLHPDLARHRCREGNEPDDRQDGDRRGRHLGRVRAALEKCYLGVELNLQQQQQQQKQNSKTRANVCI